MARWNFFRRNRRNKVGRHRFPLTAEALEERTLMTGIFASNVPVATGVTTDSSGNVYVSHTDINPLLSQEEIATFSPTGVLKANVIVEVSAIPGALQTLGSSASQLNSGLKPGDILELQPDGELFAYRPSTGHTALVWNLSQLSADESSIYDIQTGTYNNFGGAITLSNADFGDFGVYNNDLVASAESNGLDFVMRVGFSNGAPSTSKVLISSIASDGGGALPAGVAVNSQGTVLTTLPYAPSGNPNLGYDVAVGFNLFFDQGQAPQPTILTFGASSPPQISSRGITIDGDDNFAIATGPYGSQFTNFSPGIVEVTAGGFYATGQTLGGSAVDWGIAVDAVTSTILTTWPAGYDVLSDPLQVQAGTSTNIISSVNPSVYGQSVTFTATVAANPPDSGTPTGTVTFMDGSTTLGTGTLNSSAVATFSTMRLSAGAHSIIAVYSGDANDLGSTGTLTNGQTVSAAPLTITANNANKSYGQTATFAGTAFTTSGLVNGDTVGSVTETSAGSGPTAAVGTYPIVPSAATFSAGLSNNYTITYANGTLTVTAAALTSIAVAPASPSVAKGLAQQFTATGTYTDGSTANLTSQVTWASATPSVATISSTGLAQSLATGTTNITAALGSVTSPTDTLTVTATALTSIAVAPASPSVAKGLAQQFTATGTYTDGSTANLTSQVTWASATPSVATISSTGLATGVAQGTSVITATLGTVASPGDTLTVTTAAMQSIAVTPASPSVLKGQTQQFTATGTYSDSTTQNLTSQVTWASATTSVATITSAGSATAVATGTSTISATLGGISGSTVMTVSAAALQSIVVTPANPSVPKGQTQQFTATGTYADSTTQNLTSQVTWTSATTSVATVTSAGLATAMATGTSTISATLGGISGSTAMTVSAAVLQSIALTPANPSVPKGETQQFTATGTYSDSSTQNITNQVTWASATTSVGTITSAGLATAVATGTSNISVTLGGVSGSTVMTVSASAGQIEFSAPTYGVAEDAGIVTITATRTGGSSGAVSAHYATSDGTGKAGIDYTAVSNTLSWADGDAASKTFTITILDVPRIEGDETLNLSLSAPGGGASLGTPSTATLTIRDVPAVVQFASGTFTTNVTDGSTQILLTRTNNLPSTVSVVVSSPGGHDLAAFQQTITFSPNNPSAVLTNPMQNDGQPGESDVAIPLSLSSPGPGASLGTTTSATLVVHDNNPFPPLVTVTSLQLPTIKVKTGTSKKAKTKTETVVQLHLSGPLNGAGNLGAYKLLSGQTKRGVTTFNKVVPLASAVYNSTALTVTFIPAGKLNLSNPKQLRITAALLTDAYGRPLDGNYDGQPGGNFVGTFKNRGITFAQVKSAARIEALSASSVDAVFEAGLIP